MTHASIARPESAGASDDRLRALVVALLERSVTLLEHRAALLENHISLRTFAESESTNSRARRVSPVLPPEAV